MKPGETWESEDQNQYITRDEEGYLYSEYWDENGEWQEGYIDEEGNWQEEEDYRIITMQQEMQKQRR